MPKRKSVIRFFSDEVQGEGSWVLVALPTVEEMREIRKTYKDLTVAEEDTFDFGISVIRKYTKDWNWVFQDDQPMPKPKEDPSVFDKLIDPEVSFLSACISGTEQDSKN